MVKGAGIILVLPDGRLVMQRRGQHAPIDANMLGIFGGHTKPREKAEETMLRELQEETDIDISQLKIKHLLHTSIHRPKLGLDEAVDVYMAKIPSADFMIYEGAGAEAYTFEELLRRDDVEPDMQIIFAKLKNESYGFIKHRS